MNASPNHLLISALRQAIPYLRLFKAKTFVVKLGGAIVAEPERLAGVAQQAATLVELGMRVVLVHGGGPQTSELAKRLGLEPTFVDGRRVTDSATLEAAVMAMNGTARTRILAACRAAGVQAVGLSGIDAGLIRAVRRPAEPVDFGEVGDIVGINSAVLQHMLEARTMPVISPLSADEQGRVLNINADTVAASIAKDLKAAKLLFLGDTPGLLEDPADAASLVSLVDLAGVERLVQRGKVAAGMLPKLAATKEALRGGVERVHMLCAENDGLLAEIFTNEGVGTLIVRDLAEVLPAELKAAQTPAANPPAARQSNRMPAVPHSGTGAGSTA